jgi:hypothetical protein
MKSRFTKEMIQAGAQEFAFVDLEAANAGASEWVADIDRATERAKAKVSYQMLYPDASSES